MPKAVASHHEPASPTSESVKAEPIDEEKTERCKTIREALKKQLADAQRRQLDLAGLKGSLARDAKNPLFAACINQIDSVMPLCGTPGLINY